MIFAGREEKVSRGKRRPLNKKEENIETYSRGPLLCCILSEFLMNRRDAWHKRNEEGSIMKTKRGFSYFLTTSKFYMMLLFAAPSNPVWSPFEDWRARGTTLGPVLMLIVPSRPVFFPIVGKPLLLSFNFVCFVRYFTLQLSWRK